MGIWALVAVIGAVVGAGIFAASKGQMRGGILLTMLVGAVAAVATTWLGNQLGIATHGTMMAYLVAAIGTALILAIWRVTMGRA